MPLQITCPDCSRKLRVSDDRRGKRVKCPCGKILAVGAPSTSPPPPKSATRVVECPCGTKLKVESSSAGKQVQCPKCQRRLTIKPAGTSSISPAPTTNTNDPFVVPTRDANDPFAPPASATDPFAAAPAPSAPSNTGVDPWGDLPSVPAGASAPAATASFPAAAPAATFPTAPAPAPQPAASPINRDEAALAAAGGYSPSIEERQVAVSHGEDGGFEFNRFHLAIVIMFFVGPAMCFFGYKDKMRHDHIKSTGTATVGMITDGWEERGRKGRRSYYLEVSWASEEGTEYTDDFSVSGSYYGEVALGMPIPVQYDNEDPSELILLDDKDNSMFTVFFGAALFLASLGGIAWTVYSDIL